MLKNNFKKILCLVFLLIGIVSYWSYSLIDDTPKEETIIVTKPLDNLKIEERLSVKKNILVLGVDSRPQEDDKGRSDTLIVVMLDTDNKSISLLSVPRDTRVQIPGYGWDKINHAYMYEDHQLTKATTEEFLGIRLHNYVLIDFKGFKGIVDAIGGVTIDIPKPMRYYDPWDGFKVDLAPGKQHLDAEKAIQFVRYRDEEGDVGRIKRQQQFLRAVYEKVTSVEIVPRLPALVKEVAAIVQTDLSIGEMVDVAKGMHEMLKNGKGLQMATVPGLPDYIDGISYWIPDITDLRQQMVNMQGAEMTERYRRGAERMEAEYIRNIERAKANVAEEMARKAEQEKEKHKKISEKDIIKKEVKKEKAKETKKKTEIKQTDKIETKPTQETVAAKVAEKSTVTEPDKKLGPKAPIKTGAVITVVVIDCSDDPAKAASAAERLRGIGISVIEGGSGNLRQETLIVSTTTSGRVVSKLTMAPFVHGMSISRKAAVDYDGIVYVGKDFQ